MFVSRSMGKTIQMISLFVSDLKRPNLVIASVSLALCICVFDNTTPQADCCNHAMAQ